MHSFKFYNKKGRIPGVVKQTSGEIVYAEGLLDVKPDGLVVFKNNETGRVLSLTENYAEILTYSKRNIRVGTEVVAVGKELEIGLNDELLGKIIDPFGFPLDPKKQFKIGLKKEKIEAVPRGIVDRRTITRPLETGVTIVDLLVPLGLGQRELIIGDRKSGKTSFLFQSAKSAVKQGLVCVYAAIGKKRTDIKRIEDYFFNEKISAQSIIVATSSEDPPGVICVTPYTAMTIAEYFRDQGRDVLLILDDLTTHAKLYREISLSGNRFPGRNSYPGDIFYVHARLLERAGNFKVGKGEASITCFPVAETLQGDLSGYIQTNIMSMTDGHIYFDSNLFTQGRRPAINPFLSVTRVGKQTQSDVRRYINRELLAFLTLYDKMKSFTHFGAEITDNAKTILTTGRRLNMLLDQDITTVVPADIQTIMFGLLWSQTVATEEPEAMKKFINEVVKFYETNQPYQTLIKSMVTESKSFNQLLGKIVQNKAKLVS